MSHQTSLVFSSIVMSAVSNRGCYVYPRKPGNVSEREATVFFANSDLNIDTPHPEWRKAKPAPL